jgi:hypothetical protein
MMGRDKIVVDRIMTFMYTAFRWWVPHLDAR